MITYTTVSNPQYTKNNTAVNLTVKFNHIATEVPFSATPSDIEPHGVELYNRAIAGDFGPIAEYVEPVQPTPP